MSVADIAFYCFAVVTVAAGLMVTVSRNPVHSVLWLILAFLSSAGLFVLLGAEFVAMLLIIVYVGAVAVLFLFVVMMLDVDFAELKGEMARTMPLALLVGVIIILQFGMAYAAWTQAEGALGLRQAVAPAVEDVQNTKALGLLFYDKYISCKRGINTVKIFLSAYACEPDRGSEPGVGWRWAMGLASRVELHVLTRESNRVAIENALDSLSSESPLKSATFVYHDLSKPLLWLKKRGLLTTMAYYALWQWSASRRFAYLADEADVIHHLTFCTLLCPGFWKPKKAKFVIGPVGAPLVNRHGSV